MASKNERHGIRKLCWNALEFEFGWDKTKIMADVRDAMNKAETKFPAGADKYSINEFNFSEFPVIIVNLTGKCLSAQ